MLSFRSAQKRAAQSRSQYYNMAPVLKFRAHPCASIPAGTDLVSPPDQQVLRWERGRCVRLHQWTPLRSSATGAHANLGYLFTEPVQPSNAIVAVRPNDTIGFAQNVA